MQIIIKNKRCSIEKLKKEYPNCVIFDVTSKGDMKTLSPFYPHGGIKVPCTEYHSQSVEGVWQGLKVFEHEGIDVSSFQNNTMKNLKRTCRTHGKCLGHKFGIQLLGYIDARLDIYIPAYNWVLEYKCQKELNTIREAAQKYPVILLDYDTNEDVFDPSKPLSHASLIKKYLMKD